MTKSELEAVSAQVVAATANIDRAVDLLAGEPRLYWVAQAIRKGGQLCHAANNALHALVSEEVVLPDPRPQPCGRCHGVGLIFQRASPGNVEDLQTDEPLVVCPVCDGERFAKRASS